jgi:hypothetical protein
MKRIILINILLLTLSIPALSLSPFNFSWYAIDNTGQVLPSESATLTVKITITQGATTLYKETHASVSTDQFATFTVRVGTGTVTSGNFGPIVSAADVRIYAEVKKGTGTYVLCSVMGLSSWLSRGGGDLWTDIGGDNIARITGTSSNVMTIKSSGDIGIGTASPAAMLDIQPNSTTNTTINIGKLNQNGQKAITIEVAADTDGDVISGTHYKLTTGIGHISGNRFAYAISTEIESDATFTYPTSVFPVTNAIYNIFKTNTDVAGEYHGLMRGMRNHIILNGDRSFFTSISNWWEGDGNNSMQTGIYNYSGISGNNNNIIGISNSFLDNNTITNNEYTGLGNNVRLLATSAKFYGHSDEIRSANASNTAYSLYSIDNNSSTAGTIYGVYINFDDTDLTRWGIYQAGGSTNFFNGDVGIGTNTPARKLHVTDAMRLDPLSTAPSSPATGDMYMDDGTNTSTGNPKLMVYDGTTWQECW